MTNSGPKWIAFKLEEAGYSVVIQAWDFRPGGNFVLEMLKAAETAERTIAVISKNYLESEFTQSEWSAAFTRDPDGRKRQLIPVRIDNCQPQGLLSSIICVDFVGLSERNAESALLSAVSRPRAKPKKLPSYPGTGTTSLTPEKTRSSMLDKKIESGSYDVFFSYNSDDVTVAKELGSKLKDRAILPWLDVWEIRPGTDWQSELEKQIASIDSAVVLLGPSGIGPWQDLEKRAFIQQFISNGAIVIPVILPECDSTPELPAFLRMLHAVDFRKSDPDPIAQLIWGITGRRPESQ